jgi:hypothetical protein
MVQGVSNLAAADYILIGTLTADGPAWAWYHKAEFDKGLPHSKAAMNPLDCSTARGYSIRTAWVPIPNLAVLPDGAGKLNAAAACLAKIAARLGPLPETSPAAGP